jgi:hypothetical protein
MYAINAIFLIDRVIQEVGLYVNNIQNIHFLDSFLYAI